MLVAAAPSGKKEKAASEGGTASADTVKLVEYFIKTPTGNLSPDAVPYFMQVDPATLPVKLRGGYYSKKEELLALRKIAEGKKKPPMRRIGNDEAAKCEIQEGSPQKLSVFRMAGYADIAEDEERFLMQKTKCAECELQEEFSLQILEFPPKKKGEPPTRRYMLHANDPLFTLIGEYRSGQSSRGTNFFGIAAAPQCR